MDPSKGGLKDTLGCPGAQDRFPPTFWMYPPKCIMLDRAFFFRASSSAFLLFSSSSRRARSSCCHGNRMNRLMASVGKPDCDLKGHSILMRSALFPLDEELSGVPSGTRWAYWSLLNGEMNCCMNE